MSETTDAGVVTRSVAEQVRQAVENYGTLPPAPKDESVSPEQVYLATPDRLAFALGWLVANQIVQERFASSGIDALPIYHPERGWDRFLLTRRVSGRVFRERAADEFGQLRMNGTDAPRLMSPEGKTLLRLGQALQDDPQATVDEVLARIPSPYINTNRDNKLSEREQTARYPAYFDAVTQLILEQPGLVVTREIYIPNQEVNGEYHALYLHGAELGPGDKRGINLAGMTWNWFQLQYGNQLAFFDKWGKRAIYRTDEREWKHVNTPPNEESAAHLRQRIAGWLRLNGAQPDPDVD